MGIKAQFNSDMVKRMVAAKMKPLYDAMELRLTTVGLEFVTDARLKAADIVNISTVAGQFIPKHVNGPRMVVGEGSPSYIDRTGNLRSSIGYVLMKDGKQVKSDFEKTADGNDGKAKAISYAAEVGAKYSGGFTLVVVAGMEYAAAVESKGFDVITGSSFEAVRELKKHFKQK